MISLLFLMEFTNHFVISLPHKQCKLYCVHRYNSLNAKDFRPNSKNILSLYIDGKIFFISRNRHLLTHFRTGLCKKVFLSGLMKNTVKRRGFNCVKNFALFERSEFVKFSN